MSAFIYKRSHYLLHLLRGLKPWGAPPHPGPGAGPSARGFSGDRSGVAVVLVALAMPVLFGTMGLAAEASYWYVHQRGMQNAADAAAIAAATNASSGYAGEAKAVAAQYGFTDGSGNVTVTAANPSTASGCTTPAGNANACYTVTVSDKVQLFLSQLVGYAGNTTIGKNGATALAATSVANSGPAYPYCILALAPSGYTPAILTNGAPKADLAGCKIMSNTDATCHGSDLYADIGDAHGTNNNCGVIEHSNQPAVADPYKAIASNIPADPCAGIYPQEPGKKGGWVPPATPNNQWSGSYSLSGYWPVCGDLQLTGNTTIDAPSNAVLVIYNGQLDTGPFTLNTTSGSGLTIVFTGDPNNATYQHYPSGGGTLDIVAPTSGPWSGMALYQDPNLIDSGGNLDISAAGNSPTWDISGMVYLPNASVLMSGAVSKGSNGLRCFGMTVDHLRLNGTASIFKDDTQCKAAGLALPTGGHRGVLVN